MKKKLERQRVLLERMGKNKMYIDSANEKEIVEAFEYGIIKGVTTNPTILLKEKKERLKQIESILRINNTTLFVQILGDTSKEMMNDALFILNNFSKDNLILKIPITLEGLKVIKQLRNEKKEVKILGTVIYSANQGIAAGIAGVDFVAPYVNRMLVNSIDAYLEISKMKEYFSNHEINCQIMGASFKNANQVSEALISGADTVTVPLDILKQFASNDLAIHAVEVFNQHGKELNNINKMGNE